MAEAATREATLPAGRPAGGTRPAGAAARDRPPPFAALRRLRSASLATGSATAFLLLVALLSLVPDPVLDDSLAWQLRGSLPPDQPPAPARRLARHVAS